MRGRGSGPTGMRPRLPATRTHPHRHPRSQDLLVQAAQEPRSRHSSREGTARRWRSRYIQPSGRLRAPRRSRRTGKWWASLAYLGVVDAGGGIEVVAQVHISDLHVQPAIGGLDNLPITDVHGHVIDTSSAAIGVKQQVPFTEVVLPVSRGGNGVALGLLVLLSRRAVQFDLVVGALIDHVPHQRGAIVSNDAGPGAGPFRGAFESPAAPGIAHAELFATYRNNGGNGVTGVPRVPRATRGVLATAGSPSAHSPRTGVGPVKHAHGVHRRAAAEASAVPHPKMQVRASGLPGHSYRSDLLTGFHIVPDADVDIIDKHVTVDGAVDVPVEVVVDDDPVVATQGRPCGNYCPVCRGQN